MMKVYDLAIELARDPEQVELAQALTLNPKKPYLGLKGNHGLFGSSDWWQNIRNGVIPTKRLTGVIQRVYVSGQDASDQPNTFDMTSNDGNVYAEGIYVNSPDDAIRFKSGCTVDVFYAFDELKSPLPNGEANFSKIVLEMFISS
jgi:hypothetical protein